jgi:hypothetical protein
MEDEIDKYKDDNQASIDDQQMRAPTFVLLDLSVSPRVCACVWARICHGETVLDSENSRTEGIAKRVGSGEKRLTVTHGSDDS